MKVAQSCPTLCNPMGYSPRNSPGQNTGVGSLSLPQGIFPTQGPKPGLLHCRWILYQLRPQRKPMAKADTKIQGSFSKNEGQQNGNWKLGRNWGNLRVPLSSSCVPWSHNQSIVFTLSSSVLLWVGFFNLFNNPAPLDDSPIYLKLAITLLALLLHYGISQRLLSFSSTLNCLSLLMYYPHRWN